MVCLGNPGNEYTETRHNAGFWFADRLARQYETDFHNESRFNAHLSRIQTPDMDFWVCKPQLFMNRSGSSVQTIISFYKFPLDQILVVHDEIDLEPGIIRLKDGGGHGGNNGVRDIIAQMGSNHFLRLRIGVGHPGEKDRVTDHVLGRPSADEKALIDDAVEKGLTVVPLIAKGNLSQAMHTLHSP